MHVIQIKMCNNSSIFKGMEYLKHGELFCLEARQVCVYELREQELFERWTRLEDGWRGKRWGEERHVATGCHGHLVPEQ